MSIERLEAIFFYLKALVDKHQLTLPSEEYEVGLKTILFFEQWYSGKNISADDLYKLINLNDDEESIFDFAEFGNNENPEIMCMWQLTLSVLMAIVSLAYQKAGQIYVPQDIEIIKHDEIPTFFQLIINKQYTEKELYEYFCKSVCY